MNIHILGILPGVFFVLKATSKQMNRWLQMITSYDKNVGFVCKNLPLKLKNKKTTTTFNQGPFVIQLKYTSVALHFSDCAPVPTHRKLGAGD